MTHIEPHGLSPEYREKIYRKNFVFFLTDGILFTLAMSILGPSTLIPDFIRRLTNSEILIGFSSSLFDVGWTLPQLFIARYIVRFERKKWWFAGPNIPVRFVMFIFAIITVVLILMSSDFSWSPFRSQYQLQILVDQAPGVAPDTPVRRRGVLIGRVDTVADTDTGALITLNIDGNKEIKSNEVARITTSLIGDAIIDFSPAGPAANAVVVKPGGPPLRGVFVPSPLDLLSNMQGDLKIAIQSLGEAGQQVAELAGKPWGQAYLQEELQRTPAREVGLRAMSRAIDDWRGFRLTPPEVTLTRHLRLHLDGVTVEIEHVGGQHAPDSLIVRVPEARVMFVSDCYYPPPPHQRKPSDTLDWDMIERLAGEAMDIFVDGHGDPRSREEFRRLATEREM